jgi:dihydrofolate reductase
MKVKLIVAMDQAQGIGKNNDLMWHLPADMKFFKETTLGHVVLMGRKNWESIPDRFRPLPGRENVVLTRNPEFLAQNAKVVFSIEQFLTFYANDNRILFIIGGAEVYKAVLERNCVEEMFITHVDALYDADTFFPSFVMEDWHVNSLFEHPKDEKHEASFTVKHYLHK